MSASSRVVVHGSSGAGHCRGMGEPRAPWVHLPAARLPACVACLQGACSMPHLVCLVHSLLSHPTTSEPCRNNSLSEGTYQMPAVLQHRRSGQVRARDMARVGVVTARMPARCRARCRRLLSDPRRGVSWQVDAMPAPLPGQPRCHLASHVRTGSHIPGHLAQSLHHGHPALPICRCRARPPRASCP